MGKKIYKIQGMHCASCASMIELDLEDAGIYGKCSYPNQTLEVDKKADKKKVIDVVTKSGYTIA